MGTGKRAEAETGKRVEKHYSSGSKVVNGMEEYFRINLVIFRNFSLCETQIRNGIGM